MFHHQRVIVEHVKDGRQHFHVIWNRVSLVTGKAVWPGKDWEKAKQICRTMEKALGLKSPTPRPKVHKGKTAFPKKGRGKSRSAKGVKHKRGVKHGRLLTSPHSSAGVLTMLNRVNRHQRKGKTSGSRFNASSNHRRGQSGSTHNVGQDFITGKTYHPYSVMMPKIILFSPSSVQQPNLFRPNRPQAGWPPAAVLDWKVWGHKNPRRFFTLWPELSR